MVGVLAVSAPLEDYSVQPCKKRQKDEDPQSKTITNYFSPLSKAIDKGLSSPKSSSIADYFIKTPPAANRERTKTTSPRGRNKEASSTPLTPSSKHVGRAAKQGKRTRLLKRLGDTVPPSDRSNGGGNPAPSGIMGSDTAALLAEICSHTADLGGEDDDVVFQSETFTTGSTTTLSRGQTLEQRTSAEPVNVEPPSTEPSDRRPPLISSVSSGDKTLLGDASLEGQVNTSDNLGTLTVSFEDFMRSQGSKLESTSAGDTSDVTSATEEDLEAGLMASPKTVTIQAQVHLSPPLQSHNSTKIASIFKKSKAEKKKPEEPAPEYENGPVVSKRKSNVVIQEEDLELAVVDLDAGEAIKPKSTPAERQQFMKAFQQAGEAKAKTKKNPTKKKDLKEGTEDHHKEAEEQQAPDKAAVVENAEEMDKGTKLKRKKATPSGEIPKPAETPTNKDEETDKGTKLKKKTKPSVETPKPDEKPTNQGEETDKGTKLKRKTKQSGETPKPDEKPTNQGEETDKGTKLKRKTKPSGGTPKPAEKPPDKDEKDKKLKKTANVKTPKSSKPEKPPDKGEETDKGTKLKRKTTQQPNVETPRSSKLEEQQQPTSPHSSPVLRRSLRRPRSSPSRSPPRMAADSPIFMSTPKMKTGVYRSEVLTETYDVESPIRMRFTRVTRSNRRQQDPEDEAPSPGCHKVFQSAKKLSKAKQLLEKAKAIRQNMAKAEAPVRRVTRQRSHGTQDPVVITDAASTKKDVRKTTPLRSLNDVLGKNAKNKGALHSGHKKDLKKDKVGVITIDDSPEVSENSQDDEQCKARREFLMSGLPDSLKRQMAKTSAIMEAYSVSGSSFQTAVHVQQRDGCPMWCLAMPRCRLLADLSPLCGHVPDISRLALSLGDFTRVTSGSAVQPFPAVVLKRPVFSNIIQDFLLEEIRWHNPQFPVRRFFKQFLKKQIDYISLQDPSKSETQQTEKCIRPASDNSVQETGSGAKRKRKDSPRTKSKRRKQADEEPQCDSAPNPQLSRSSRRKSSTPAEPDVILIEEEDKGLKAPAEDAACEDVLWTEKYQPQNSSELIGNSVAIRRLHSWLREWKIRAEKEEKRNQLQKSGKDKDDTWSTGDFHDSEDSDEDSLCNTLLISGPPGVGKTAAVYACAQELGFKVFEVNASCQRSGRQILAQLKEATQSHQVDQQGVSAHKPCFFSSNSTRSPRKLLNSPKKVVSSPRKPPVSPRGLGMKKGLAPKSLTNFFFKAAPKQKLEVKRTADPVRAPQSGSEVKISDGKASRPFLSVTDGSEEAQRKTATSLILFEEVDIIFDDDTGFLGAVKTFMSTTKRPVILTTSDPTFRMTFDGAFEEISFHSPSVVNVTSFLQVLCLAENLRTDPKDLMTFVTGNRGDIRRSVLHLQFWARSGGGLVEKPLPPPDKQKMEASDDAFCKDPEIRSAEVPGCSVGCAENLLGVNSIIPPNDSLVSFVKEKILEPAEWDRILQLSSEFHCRNVSFTRSNLEFLLPLPVHIEETAAPVDILEAAPEEEEDLMEDTNVKLSAAMKRRRKLVLLNDSDLFESDSNSVDEVVSVAGPEGERAGEVREVRRVRRALSSAELQASLLVCRCLDSMAEFTDNMSFLDCATCDPADPAHSPAWTESRLKDGLCDGLRTEGRDWWSAQSCGDIRGHIEALSLHKCSSRISTSLSNLELCKLSGKDPSEELTLRVTTDRRQVHFGEPAASVGVAQSRLSVVRDVMSHRAFTGLGNRDVNVTEYLPALRTICRLQKEREEGKTKRRFLHYLEGIHLELSKTTLGRLAADFP